MPVGHIGKRSVSVQNLQHVITKKNPIVDLGRFRGKDAVFSEVGP